MTLLVCGIMVCVRAGEQEREREREKFVQKFSVVIVEETDKVETDRSKGRCVCVGGRGRV